MLKNLFFTFFCLLLFTFAAFSQDTGGFKGKIRTSNGEGVADATITARQNDADVKTVTTNGKGEFTIDGLKAGSYDILFTKQGLNQGTINKAEVKAGKIRDLGNLNLSVDGGTLIFIRGSVFREDGRSLNGAEIQMVRVFSDGKTKKIGSRYSDVAGEFVYRLPNEEATYRLTVKFDGAESTTKEMVVESSGIYRMAFTMKKKQ